MSVRINLKLDTRALNVFLNKTSEKTVRRAVARAIDRTIVTVKKQAAGDIKKSLRLPVGEIKAAIPIRKQTNPSKSIDQQSALLLGEVGAISMSRFNPTQLKAGVRVNITGKAQVLQHAFIARMPGASRSTVFRRVRSENPGTTIKRVGKNRSELPIRKQSYLGMNKLLEKVAPSLAPLANERFNIEFNRYFDYLMKA